MSLLVTSVHNDMFKRGKPLYCHKNGLVYSSKGVNHDGTLKVSGHLYAEYIGSNVVVSPWWHRGEHAC